MRLLLNLMFTFRLLFFDRLFSLDVDITQLIDTPFSQLFFIRKHPKTHHPDAKRRTVITEMIIADRFPAGRQHQVASRPTLVSRPHMTDRKRLCRISTGKIQDDHPTSTITILTIRYLSLKGSLQIAIQLFS